MASFATPAELQTFLGFTIDSARAQQLLDDATALIKEATDQFIEVVTGDVISFKWLGPQHPTLTDWDTLLLPERPVTAVTLVKVDGVTVPSGEYTFTSTGFLTRFNSTWISNGPLGVEVTYTHGFATIPADIKTICKAAAARAMTQGAESDRVLTVTAGWTPEVFLTEIERRQLMSYGPIEVG